MFIYVNIPLRLLLFIATSDGFCSTVQKLGDLSLIIPLFLEGSAFALYEQLGESQKIKK